MTIAEMQKAVLANRTKRGWESATNISQTISGLAEEVGEFSKAVKSNSPRKMVNALGDTMVYCLGAFEMLGVDGQKVLERIIRSNARRTYGRGHH